MGELDDLLRAAFLGLIQAATEFLPVSSSGHLILAPELVGDNVSTLTFDVALHLGTMLAVIAFFWRDWARIIGAGLGDIARHGIALKRWSPYGLLGLWIVVGTIPAVVVGFLFGDAIDEKLREPWIVGVNLIVFGLVMGAVDRWGGTVARLLDMTPSRALVVGVAQAVALIPGVSRAGVTITAGRALGFDRPSAARFSFLLSAPVILGAGVLKFSDALSSGETIAWGPTIVGAAVAAVVGALVIRWLLGYLQSGTLLPFVWYRIGLGALVLLLSATGVI
ncbi:MAG: undecaprenyl-diphosphate phosphatase [Chloroflexi bacterium]|nr:undecaprenyl-diphosphate phosphatase [Chloroflexota bacterium]MDA1145571.1 undecaprenyl-diphosphate phosphatase [Chloroflexota bacterium]